MTRSEYFEKLPYIEEIEAKYTEIRAEYAKIADDYNFLQKCKDESRHSDGSYIWDHHGEPIVIKKRYYSTEHNFSSMFSDIGRRAMIYFAARNGWYVNLMGSGVKPFYVKNKDDAIDICCDWVANGTMPEKGEKR